MTCTISSIGESGITHVNMTLKNLQYKQWHLRRMPLKKYNILHVFGGEQPSRKYMHSLYAIWAL